MPVWPMALQVGGKPSLAMVLLASGPLMCQFGQWFCRWVVNPVWPMVLLASGPLMCQFGRWLCRWVVHGRTSKQFLDNNPKSSIFSLVYHVSLLHVCFLTLTSI